MFSERRPFLPVREDDDGVIVIEENGRNVYNNSTVAGGWVTAGTGVKGFTKQISGGPIMNANFKKGHSRDLTEFEWQVLGAALTIPFGQTRTYRWVAEQIGRPRAVRAVGQALRNNPFPLMVPCHRVIKSDGTPGGYAGRFDGRKTRLLDTESKIIEKIKRHLHTIPVRPRGAGGGVKGAGKNQKIYPKPPSSVP